MDTESQRLLVLHRKRWKDGKQCDGRRLLDQQLRHLSKSDLSRINKKKEQSDLFLTMEKKSKDGISTGKGSDVFPQVSSLSFLWNVIISITLDFHQIIAYNCIIW